MTSNQIIALSVSMVFVGMFLCLALMIIIAFIYDFIDKRKKIIEYCKKYHNGYLPYMLVYKNLSREQKQEILKKVGKE